MTTVSILDEFETLFSKNFGAAKCWRCDDTGALRHTDCECEIGQARIEGANGARKDQPSKSERMA
jgi:hypothetical protein